MWGFVLKTKLMDFDIDTNAIIPWSSESKESSAVHGHCFISVKSFIMR
jgi:hypothetical protein